MAMCIYNNCNSVQKPFSSLAFFALPKDYRRRLWIENSGNTDLLTLSESARRVVCQKHFSHSSLRIQFHRTTLSRDAVPEHWNSLNDSDSYIEPIEIQDNDDTTDDTKLEDKIIQIDDEYDNEDDDVQQDVNDWQINYENESADQREGVIECKEYEDDDDDASLQTEDECVIDNSRNNEIDQCQQIIGEEEINPPEELHTNQFPPFYHEIEIETADSEKRKKMDMVNVTSVKIAKQCSGKPLDDLGNDDQCMGVATDVIVSSSTNKSDVNASGLLSITNEEDKYFALALVGILQRIAPQKKAFAKVNILRYLTELEYGVEATIN